jgi:hypothetical protein
MAPAPKIRPLNSIFPEAAIAEASSYVDHVFNNAPDRYETTRLNPVIGGSWVSGLDPIEPEKEAAVRALLAQRWFASHGPADPDLQPLPLGYGERERLKRGGASHILAWYARSLDALEYDVTQHPLFHDYACGVMACFGPVPPSITEDKQLQRRFPPRPLSGLISGLIWLPPEEYERCPPSMKFKEGTHEKITDQTR